MAELNLYYKPMCPYCRKVLNHLEQTQASLTLKDIEANPENEKELLSIGGKSQVPCLVIDGKALYESDDIIKYLEENYSS